MLQEIRTTIYAGWKICRLWKPGWRWANSSVTEWSTSVLCTGSCDRTSDIHASGVDKIKKKRIMAASCDIDTSGRFIDHYKKK